MSLCVSRTLASLLSLNYESDVGCRIAQDFSPSLLNKIQLLWLKAELTRTERSHFSRTLKTKEKEYWILSVSIENVEELFVSFEKLLCYKLEHKARSSNFQSSNHCSFVLLFDCSVTQELNPLTYLSLTGSKMEHDAMSN